MKAKDALQELKRDKERKYSGFTLIQPEDFPLCMPAGHHSSCWIWIQHEQPHGQVKRGKRNKAQIPAGSWGVFCL